MNPSILTAAASMQGLQKKMDILSNNVANVNTNGYKKQEASFSDVLTSTKKQLADFELEGRRSPLGLMEGWGSQLARMQIDMTQGTLQQTDLPLDVAIEGNGLFEISEVRRDNEGEPVLDASGVPQLDRLWTRDGSFQLSTLAGDPENAYLATKSGTLVRGLDDQPIAIPQGHRINIDSRGNVLAYNDNNTNAAPIVAGQLKIVEILRPQMLESIGNLKFRVAGGAANIDGVLAVQDLNAQENDSLAIRQGFVEQSNVDLTKELTELISVQRSLQFSGKALSSADQMMSITNRLRG